MLNLSRPLGIAFATFALLVITTQLKSVKAADLEMVDAFGNITGVVDVSRRGITVFENSGHRWFYQREPQYDLPGGRYLGFYNPELHRAIRFPMNGRGPIERADFDQPLARFVPASVTVRPIGSGRGFDPYLDDWRNSSGGTAGFSVPMPTYGTSSTPYGPLPSYASPRQYGGIGIGVSSGNSIGSPLIAQPRSMLLESNVVANIPLSPVEVELINSSGETLNVTLIDHTNPNQPANYRLSSGARQRVKLPRDSGSTQVRVYETTDAIGQPIQQEVRQTLPPKPRFEVIVHRIQIQSIAIDRTGKSPNPIEDINVQGVGLGRFWLPPGDQLTSGPIDVGRRAVANANPGAVAPLIP